MSLPPLTDGNVFSMSAFSCSLGCQVLYTPDIFFFSMSLFYQTGALFFLELSFFFFLSIICLFLMYAMSEGLSFSKRFALPQILKGKIRC